MTKEEFKADITQRLSDIREKIAEHLRKRNADNFKAVKMILACADGTEEDFGELLNPFEHYEVYLAKSIIFMMNRLKLKQFSTLKEWSEGIKEYAGYMISCVEGKAKGDELSKLEALKDESFKNFRDDRPSINLLAAMICFMNQCHVFDFDGITQAYLEAVNLRSMRYIFRSVLSVLSEIEPEQEEGQEQQEQDVKALTVTLNDLRSSLENEKNRTERYKRELETLKKDSEKTALLRIFRRMNSNDMENMLDQFAVSSDSLRKLQSEGFEIPAQMNSCAICVDMFMRALSELGIERTLNIGDTLSITLEESGEYDYIGSDFENDEERKTVQVRTPGWTYEGTIISLPKVYEVNQSA